MTIQYHFSQMKTCFKCDTEKPLAEFRHARMADGHLNKCKECTKRDVREHRKENDSVRQYDRQRASQPHRRAKAAEYHKQWCLDNPEKRAAHRALNNALRSGKVVKADNCSRCGSDFAIEGHHHNYSKPLDVEWLCSLCHKREHLSF